MSDLTKEEQARGLRFLRAKCGGWLPVCKALRAHPKTLRRAASASIAVRVARFVGVGVDDVLIGRFPPQGTCPYCALNAIRYANDCSSAQWSQMSDGSSASREPNKTGSNADDPGSAKAQTDDRVPIAGEDNAGHREEPKREPSANGNSGGSGRFVGWLQANNGAVTGVATIGILIATTVYAFISYRQLSAMKEQAADAQKSFFASERPWVTLRHPPGEDELVMFNAKAIVRNGTTGNFDWPVTFFLTNVGHSPAQNVMIHAKLASINPSDPGAIATLHRWRDFSCEESCIYPSTEAPGGLVVFPGQSRGPEPATTSIPAQYLGVGTQLYLMVCITYESMLGATSHHRTQLAILVTDTRGPITPQTETVPFDNQRCTIPLEFQSSAAD